MHKSYSSRNLEKFPFNRIQRLAEYSLQRCQKHLTRFLKDVLKLTENFQEVVSNLIPYQNTQTYMLPFSTLRVFKTPEMASITEFFFQKQALMTSLQNNCSKQQQTLSGNFASVLEKDFTIDVLLHKKLQKTLIKTLKGKKISDADAEMPIPRCRCRDFQTAIIFI